MDPSIVLLFLGLFFFIFILVQSADLISTSFVGISKKMGISEFFLGFLFLSIISSIPEISIAINSKDIIPQLSIGNLFGAKLVLLGLLGSIAIIRFGSLEFKGRFGERENIIALFIMLLMVVVIVDGYLAVSEGLMIVFLYISYVATLAYKFRALPKQFHIIHLRNLKRPKVKFSFVIVKLVLGAIGVILASNFIVKYALEIGDILNISEALIGLIVLAIGTNLTELSVLITSSAKIESERKLTMGNIIGSATINSFIYGLLIISTGGITLSLKDLTVITPVMFILTITIIGFFIFSITGKKVTRFEGYLLFGLYMSLILTEFLLILFQ